MLESTRERLLESIGPHETVLDVGGWADPFSRADWVMDLMPYETRGFYGRKEWVQPREEQERFTRETWVQRDICKHEPYPFANKEIDFVICAQTLEDIRDPIWVCSELNRIAKAGYIEVPSRLEEQSWGVAGEFVGWGHHRWLIDVTEDGIEFVLKPHSIHARPDHYFPRGFWHRLPVEEKVQLLWWTDGFVYRERIVMDKQDGDRYIGGFVEQELRARGLAAQQPDDLPSESAPPAGIRGRRLRRSLLGRFSAGNKA